MDNLNLVESWLKVELCVPGMSIAQAIRNFNEKTGTRYTPQDFGKWRRGARSIPQPVQDYMLRVSIAHALRCEGIDTLAISDEALDQIAARLTPPQRL